jgi:hypothetical protein
VQPKPLPKKFERAWQKWPSFDDLRAQNPQVKQHQLRAALQPVPCYRCPDQSARYLPERAKAAILNIKSEAESAAPDVAPAVIFSVAEKLVRGLEEDDDDREEIELAEPKIYDAMVLFRQSLLISDDLRKGLGDLAESMTKAIDSMTKPLALGLDLVREQTLMMSDRLKHYEAVSDRMQQVTESLISEQQSRELAQIREKASQEMKKRTLDVATQYIPTIVENFKPNAAASAALKAIKTLEPEVLDAIVDGAEMTEEQKQAWTMLRDVVRPKHQPPHQHPSHDGNSHTQSPPS